MHFLFLCYISCVWEIFLKVSFLSQVQFFVVWKVFFSGFECLVLTVFVCFLPFCILYIVPCKSKYFPPFYSSLSNNRCVHTWNLSQNRECSRLPVPSCSDYFVSLWWVLVKMAGQHPFHLVSFWEMVCHTRKSDSPSSCLRSDRPAMT